MNWTRSSGTHTLNPGVYCNGITLNNDERGNLNPGEYIIRGGGITLASNAWIVGDGVFFYLTGNGTYPYKPLDFQSSAQITAEGTDDGDLCRHPVLPGSRRWRRITRTGSRAA